MKTCKGAETHDKRRKGKEKEQEWGGGDSVSLNTLRVEGGAGGGRDAGGGWEENKKKKLAN